MSKKNRCRLIECYQKCKIYNVRNTFITMGNTSFLQVEYDVYKGEVKTYERKK